VARGGFVDAYTAYHHLRAAAGAGVVAGVFVLNEFILRKGLGGTRWHIVALLLIPALAQSVVVLFNPLDPQRPMGRRPFRRLGIPIQFLLFLPLLGLIPAAPTALVSILVLAGVIQMFLIPIQNGILARNYDEAIRGRRFGVATAVQAVGIVVVSVPAGWWLDANPDAWPWLYALAGAAGVYAYVHWSRVRRRRIAPLPQGVREHRSPWEALRHDRAFRGFEASFMLYGLGFLMLQPVLPLYLIDELGVTYSQAGLAKGAIFWVVMILAAPFLGRISDAIGVLRLGALSFFVLALFPLALLLLPGEVGLYAGFAVYGLAMSGVFLTWTLGPMLFARGRDPHPYLNAHLGLVGFRALVGMVAATLLQRELGSRTVFAVCVALEVFAAVSMLHIANQERLRRAAARLNAA
jgi:MFS family permease